MNRNVILTGFMGSGKTTVGRILAKRLGQRFIDTDTVIEARHGPVSRIVRRSGWPAFRAMEREVARELVGNTGLVISTGGRMMLDPQCAACLEPGGDVVWLKADPAAIVARVVTGPDVDPSERPMLALDGADPHGADPHGKVAGLLARRAELYGRYRSVDTTNLTPDEAADAVLALLGLEAPTLSAVGTKSCEYGHDRGHGT